MNPIDKLMADRARKSLYHFIIDFMPEQKNLKTHCLMRKKVFRNERAWKMFAIK